MDQLVFNQHFSCGVYSISKPNFLEDVKKVADRELRKLKVQDKMYPIIQTGTIFDESLQNFANYIAQISWDILSDQGYDMRYLNTSLSEMWAQQFDFRGLHVEHVHNFGAQISGFYFLEVPDNSSFPCIHDPNHAKRQIKLPELDETKITMASTTINYQVKEGDLFLFNSWLPHSFVPNRNKTKPFKFIHFNVSVIPAQQNCEIPPAAEVI
jgi:uncharacterized protein (TIGR02466 family)